MGSDQVTVKNLEIARVDNEKGELYIKGAVPGARGSLLAISAEGELKISSPVEEKQAKEEKKEVKKRK